MTTRSIAYALFHVVTVILFVIIAATRAAAAPAPSAAPATLSNLCHAPCVTAHMASAILPSQPGTRPGSNGIETFTNTGRLALLAQ